jgi:DnaJ-class molecular chaperone
MNSKTPAGLSWFVGNMLEMADRIDTWQPPNMTDCPVCKGTMSVEGHPCSICIQGKTGLYRVPDDVQAPDEKDKTYCGVCGMETLEGDICGPCEIKARQKEEKELHVKITCEECGDPVGYYDKDGNDHLDKGVVLTDDGNYYCPPCKRELDAEKGSNEG